MLVEVSKHGKVSGAEGSYRARFIHVPGTHRCVVISMLACELERVLVWAFNVYIT